MAFSDETLRLQRQRMTTLNGIVDDATRTLVRAHVRTWDQIAGELDASLLEVAATLEAGRRLSWRQMTQVDRFTAALARTAAALDDLAAAGRVSITSATGDAVQVAAEFQPRLIVSQLPPAAQAAALEAVTGRVSGRALEEITTRAQERIVSRLRPLSADAQAQMRRALVRGIVVGDNPRRTASEMLRRVETGFNGGLTRALRISRTEQLDAYRAANGAIDQANSDIVDGWTWVSAADATTCAACFAMHGTEWANEDPGPEGHVQCRCDRAPRTRSWRELGFDIDEPPSLLRDGQDAFRQLPVEAQRDVMGPARLDALDRGQIAWGDLARRVDNPDWRPSWQMAPLSDLGVETAAI